MTVDTAATSSPEAFPESPGSEARLTRLHDALKQLRAKSASNVPLSSLSPSAAKASERPPLPLPLSPNETVASQGMDVAAPPPDPAPLTPATETSETETPAFCLESWMSAVALRQYRQLAGNLASQFPSGESAAFALTVLSCRHAAATIAARLALCLAERQAGEVLLLEPPEPRLEAMGASRRANLVDVVAGRANWDDAVSPAEMAALSLIGFGSAASPDGDLTKDRWRPAVADLKQRFRYLVSSVRPGESILGNAWLAAIDGVFLAVALGNAPRSVVAACRSQLSASGAKLLGCIALK